MIRSDENRFGFIRSLRLVVLAVACSLHRILFKRDNESL